MFRNLFKSQTRTPPPPPSSDSDAVVPGLLMQNMTEAERLSHYSEQLGIPVKKRLLDDIRFQGKLDIPIQYFKRMGLAPLFEEQGILTVAINDPANFQAADDLARRFGFKGTRMVLSPLGELHSAINVLFDQTSDEAEKMVQD